MKAGLLASLGFLNITFLLVCPPALSGGVAVDPVAAAAAVRKADADWAAAAAVGSVGDWLSFYDADAIILLPKGNLASGEELVRQSVSRLLTLPHLSLAWRPIESTVVGSGVLAVLVEAYELRFDDSRGVPVSDRGRRLEIWRKRADGSWKCIVDTWNLDAAIATPAAAAPPRESTRGTSAGSTAPLAQEESPAPAAAPESGPPVPAREATTKYGDMPTHYAEAIRQYYRVHLKHPESVQYREISPPEQGYITEITGGLLMREKHEYGWTVKATINAKDSHDNYVGFKSYTFLFRGEKIVDARLPLPADEMN
jgi:ketosteroid isomerase-like protein